MTYCPAHDPLMQAISVCSRCGRISYPVDAAWLDPPLLLVSYRAGCDHARDRVELVDTTQLRPADFCHALTRAGEPCRNRGRPDLDGRCHQHAPRQVR